MRKLVALFVILLLLVGGASAASWSNTSLGNGWTGIQSASGSGGPASVSFPNNIGSGHQLTAYVFFNRTTASGPPTMTGNTFVDSGAGCPLGQGSTVCMAIYVVCNSAAGAGVKIVTAPSTIFSMHIFEESGGATTSCVDVTSSNANATGSAGTNGLTSNAVTTTGADLVFGGFEAQTGPLSAGTSTVTWNSPEGDVQGLMQWATQAAGGSITSKATSGAGASELYSAVTMALKPAGGAAAPKCGLIGGSGMLC